MPFDPNGLYETVSHLISKFPPALFAAALLGGPTLIWMIIRFFSPPTASKQEEVGVQELLWVCAGCRSINDDRLFRCYSCHRLRAADLIPVMSDAWTEDAPYEWGEEEPDGWEEYVPEELEEDGLEVGISVGPGLPASLPIASSWLGAEVTGASGATEDRDQPELESELELEPELDVAVGSDVTPGGFQPLVLEPRLRVSARTSRSDPRPEPRSEPRSEPRREPRHEPRTGLRSTTRSAPRGRWTDLPPADPPPADPPEAADEAIPKRRARGRKSAGG